MLQNIPFVFDNLFRVVDRLVYHFLLFCGGIDAQHIGVWGCFRGIDSCVSGSFLLSFDSQSGCFLRIFFLRRLLAWIKVLELIDNHLKLHLFKLLLPTDGCSRGWLLALRSVLRLLSVHRKILPFSYW